MKNNNDAVLAGTVATEPAVYVCCGEEFYSFDLAIKRESGTEDIIPVNVSRYILKNVNIGEQVCLTGQIRAYNRVVEDKSRLIIVFFAKDVKDYEKDINTIYFTGTICKEPILRTTPLGRNICDILLAVNRERGKSDYIPCIIWGRTAIHIGQLTVGAKVAVEGRIQSRIYTKKLNENESVERKALEVSVNRIQEAANEQ